MTHKLNKRKLIGIWTVESMLLGVPIFGYGQWATAELVDEDCGVLVSK